RTTEHCGVRVKFDYRLAIEHLFDPENIAAFLLCSREGFAHFLGDLRRVRRTRAEHDREIGIHEWNRAHQVNNSLLSRDPAYEKQIRLIRIDAVAQECLDRINLPIFIEIDSVVNHMDALWIDIEEALDVALG